MYINDYTNRWAYWFGTAAIQHTEYNSTESNKTGYGSIVGSLGGLSYPSNWSSTYNTAFHRALRTAAGGHITPLGLQAINASGSPSDYFPILKLCGRTSEIVDLYLKFPISIIPHSTSEVKPTGSSPSGIYYGRYQNTNTTRYITQYGALTPEASALVEFNSTLNGFYVETYGTGLGDVTCQITDLEYNCLIDNDNGNIGLRFLLSYTLTDVDTEETDSDTMREFIIYLSLGGSANGYGFEEQEGGLYPVPTSLIPLRDVLNAHGTNFNTNIDVYDETQEDVNNMFLANYVGTLAYTFVKFETPVGTIRCYTPMQFTHFVTRSFTDNDTPRVYRVVRYRVVNTNVIEYDFVVDYLKDYWQHFGITAESMPLLLRSTDSDDYNKHISDPLIPYNGTFTPEIYHSTTSLRVCIVLCYPDTVQTGRESGTLSFAMPIATYTAFLNWWRTDQTVLDNMGVFSSYILDVYLIPYSGSNDIYISQVNSFSFTNTNGDTATFTGTDIWRVNTSEFVSGQISNYVQSSIVCTGLDMADSRYFESHPIAHIPCYGDVTVPREALEYLDANNLLSFKYILNVSDGAVAISFEPFTDVLQAVALPRLPLPENNQVQALRSVERNRQNAYESALAGAGMSAVTGNFLGIGAAAVSAITATSSYARQADQVRETVGQTSFKTSGLISTYQQQALRFNIPDTSVNLSDFYDLNGYPCLKKWQSALDGCRYWIELQGSLKGTEEYIAGVRAAIDGRGIVYNYT